MEQKYQRCQPASIRLMDNEQFKLGQTLRPKMGTFHLILDHLKKSFITKMKGFNLDHMCVATLLFEGSKEEVEAQEKKIYSIAKQVGGVPAGEKNGERGYMLTFVIAYIRDAALKFNVLAESFETSVPWDNALTVCRNVKYVVAQKCKEFGINHFFISHRVTQTYDCGCCIYFYLAFNWEGLEDPVGRFEAVEHEARAEILRWGGSLSHHHGVGKLRAGWYPGQVSPLAAQLYAQAKRHLDPNNIFAVDNLLPRTPLSKL